ncbi:hypothetical protein Tco_0660663 [Tanacetum coccineum]
MGNSKNTFLNELDRLSREYYYADHMNAILGIYTDLDEFIDLQCDYGEEATWGKSCERLEKEFKGYINGVNSRTRQPMAVPVRTTEKPKHNVNKSVATSRSMQLVVFLSIHPSGYKMENKSEKGNVNPNVSMPLGNASRTANILEPITPSAQQPTMSGNLKLLTNFMEKFLGTVKFGNDQIAPILGYGDLVQDLYSISLQDSFLPIQSLLNGLKQHRFSSLVMIVSISFKLRHHNWLSKNCIVNGLPKLKFVQRIICASSCELGLTLDELPLMEQITLMSFYNGPHHVQERVLEQGQCTSPVPQSQENVPQAAESVTTSNELELLIVRLLQ